MRSLVIEFKAVFEKQTEKDITGRARDLVWFKLEIVFQCDRKENLFIISQNKTIQKAKSQKEKALVQVKFSTMKVLRSVLFVKKKINQNRILQSTSLLKQSYGRNQS